MTRTRVAGAWLAVAIFLGGCNCCCGSITVPFLGPHPPDLSISDVAGTYQGPKQARVTLVADGTFTAEHLDDCGPDHFGQVEGPASGAGDGMWALGGEGDWGQAITLELDFGPPDGFDNHETWYAQTDRIYFLQGDPDVHDMCNFHKL